MIDAPDDALVRPAALADVAAVAAMARDLTRSTPPPPDVVDREVAEAVADERSVLLVAEVGGVVVGYALGVLAPMPVYGGMAFLQELFVRPEHRSGGLGRRLVEAFADEGRARGRGVLALSTSRAGDFYEGLGFEASSTYYRRSL